MKKIIKNILFTLFIITSIYYCIRYPADIGLAVSGALERCINIIIPSMFIFMCITSITVSSGMHNYISIPFKPIAKYIFHLDANQTGIFILSMFSGYPNGIKLITDRYIKNDISKKEFDRMSCFCFAGGPAFISGTVSGILYPGTSAGTLCFISVIIGNIAAALVTMLFSSLPPKGKLSAKTNITAECLINSTLSSAHAMFQMCTMIIAFSGILKAAELSGIIYRISDIFSYMTGLDTKCTYSVVSSLFEISNIVNMPSGSTALLPVISFLLSFGGICVLIQVIVISKGFLNIKKFLISRIFSASISAIVCHFIMNLFDLGSVVVLAPAMRKDNGYISGLLLFIMTIMLLSLFKSFSYQSKIAGKKTIDNFKIK